jgi:hypothetical protein
MTKRFPDYWDHCLRCREQRLDEVADFIHAIMKENQEMKHEIVYLECVITLNGIVARYIKEFNMRPVKKNEDKKITESEKMADLLVNASYVEDINYDNVVSACNKTIGIMKDIEYELISGDLGEHKDQRRLVEQLLSILHIGRSYPDNAIKRAKALMPKTVINRAA